MNISFNYYIIKIILIFSFLFNILILNIKNIDKLESLLYFKKKKIYKVSLVVPIIYNDFYKILYNLEYYSNFIDGIKNVIFIGNEEIEKLIQKNKFSLYLPINFINEKNLLDIDKIKKLITKRNKFAIKRSGWYIQQFLKMKYCMVCQDKFYLIWDGDTIPIKKVKMFNNNGKPFFDVKTEYHKQYFITMKKIFPKLGKKYKYSFISEHMIINTRLMKNMINKISANNNLLGDTWYEKIINSIDSQDLSKSGFSEFETYGTFVKEYYKKFYDIRPWKSLRLKTSLLNLNPKFLPDNYIKNISKYYNAISFEKWK